MRRLIVAGLPLRSGGILQCEYVGPTGIQCVRDCIETSDQWCGIHCPASELDLSSFHASRLRAAKYRIAQALPDAAETVVEIMDDREAGPGNRLKAGLEVLDRGGMPRVQATILQADILTRTGKTPGQEVSDRLAALNARFAQLDPDDPDLPPVPPPALVPVPARPVVVDADPDPRHNPSDGR
jgi:hypothetical protein